MLQLWTDGDKSKSKSTTYENSLVEARKNQDKENKEIFFQDVYYPPNPIHFPSLL